VIVLATEDVEVHLRALQTMTEQFQLCEWRQCRLGKLHRCSEITSGMQCKDYMALGGRMDDEFEGIWKEAWRDREKTLDI
jgi:hypothetical protein